MFSDHGLGRIQSCGFLRIFTYKNNGLFLVRLGKGKRVPRSVGASLNDKKIYCENTKKPATSDSTHDPF